MSSSKIIKSDKVQGQVVCSFNYSILEENVPAGAAPGSDEFIPMQFNDCHLERSALGLSAMSESSEAVQHDVPGLTVSEDELNNRLDAEFTRGVEEGRRQAERGLSNVFKALRDGVSGLTGIKAKMLRESEDDLLKLTMLVAKKIIQQELIQHPEILANIVNAAVANITELDRVSVRLNPADYAVVNLNRQAYFSGPGDESHILLSPDESIEPGGCMVDTATGTVDARIETQLDEIYRQFTEKRSAATDTSAYAGGSD